MKRPSTELSNLSDVNGTASQLWAGWRNLGGAVTLPRSHDVEPTQIPCEDAADHLGFFVACLNTSISSIVDCNLHCDTLSFAFLFRCLSILHISAFTTVLVSSGSPPHFMGQASLHAR